jgi:hypothetical protein
MSKLSPELFTASVASYEGAREHSEMVDQILGFKVPDIERGLLERAQTRDPNGSHKTWGQSIHQGNQTWVGLSHQTLQTPYSELRQMCELLSPTEGSTLVDLGAGYGRLGLVLNVLYPKAHFIGYEYVPERVHEGKRVLLENNCTQSSLHVQDLTAPEFELPQAKYYFLYDYGTVTHIRKTLAQLELMALKKPFKVIARGKGTRSLIQYEHPWLCDVYPPIHEEHFSIFSMSQNL